MRQNTKQKDLASLGTFLFYPSLNRNEEAVRQCRPVSNENKLKWTAGRNINSYRPARAFRSAWRIVSSRRFGRKKRPRQTEEMNWKESTCCFLFVRFHVDRELRGNEKDDGRQKNNKSTSFFGDTVTMAFLFLGCQLESMENHVLDRLDRIHPVAPFVRQPNNQILINNSF